MREIRSRLSKAGFVILHVKGSHQKWGHPQGKIKVVIAGNDGDDAKRYIIEAVEKAIESVKS